MKTVFLVTAAAGIVCAYFAGYERGEMRGHVDEARFVSGAVRCYTTPDEDGHLIPRGYKTCWTP